MNFPKLALACASVLLSVVPSFARNVDLPAGQIQTFPGYIEVSYEGPLTAPGDELDVLFVIDDSGSMTTHQQKLIQQSALLSQNFLSNPYSRARIGVITTTVGPNPYMGFIEGELRTVNGKNYVDRNTPLVNVELARLLNVGVAGMADESPLASISLAISPAKVNGANAGFFRPGADVKIIIISDAEDSSKILPDELIAQLRSFKTGQKVSADALLALDPKICQQDETNTMPIRNSDFVNKLGGKIESICSENYANFLTESIKNDATSPAVITIPLPSAPQAETLKVTYGTQTLLGGFGNQGWVYDETSQQIRIGSGVKWSSQPAGTPVRVKYVPADWK